ncbi:MAG: TetR/AcrR family transcriptional regulator [Alkalispirochaeta sp.]
MPKIIENAGERLLDELELMFRENDGEISLRRLAARAGVAVGTIYNYFPDKDDLIKSLFQREWGQAVGRIMGALDGVSVDAGQRELAGVVVDVVYGDVERISRSGESRRSLMCRDERNTRPYPLRPEGWKWLGGAFVPVWDRVFPDGRPDAERLTVALIVTAHRLVALFPDERTANIEFLTDRIAQGERG